MTENVHVVGERLIAYLYDEADPGERALVDAHLRVCAACADELAGLGAAREHLVEWAPPDVALGFQIVRPVTSAEPPAPATVLRPARWWQQPAPAWLQVAAAFVIFAAGLALGQSRVAETQVAQSPQVEATTPQPTPQAFTAASAPAAAVTSPEVTELAREVARMREQLAALSSAPQSSAVRTAAAGDTDDLLTRVRELIADSEAGLRTDMTLRDTQLARDIELQRRRDLEAFNSSLDRVSTQTGQALRQNERVVQGLSEGLSKLVGQSLVPGR